jgi:hypothetical protein
MQAQARSTSPVLRRHCRVSPQRRVIGSCAHVASSTGVCAGQSTGETHWGSCASGIGASPEGGSRCSSTGREQARDGGPNGGRIVRRHLLARRSRPRPGAECPPAAVKRRGDGRAIRVELRHLAGKPVGGPRAPGGDAEFAAARHPEPFGSLCVGHLSHRPAASGGQRVRGPSQSRPEGCLAPGVSTEVEPLCARHAAGTR